MKSGVFCTAKMDDRSMLVSVKMTRYISNVLDLPIYGDVDVEEVDGVIIYVNGPNAWNHKATAALAKAMINCKTVVFAENDYAITRPRLVSTAKDLFGSAWWRRAETGRPPAVFWTTVRSNAGQRGLHPQSYVNWNALTMRYDFTPMSRKKASADLLYYGSYRPRRRQAFERYLVDAAVLVTVASKSSQFEELYGDEVPGNVNLQDAIPEGSLYEELTRHGLGLYIEDDRSHREFHSPANRFYEMLSAGLPMVFQPECAAMLSQAGFDVKPYVVEDGGDLMEAALRDRVKIAARQRRDWYDGHRFDLELKKQVKAAWKALPR